MLIFKFLHDLNLMVIIFLIFPLEYKFYSLIHRLQSILEIKNIIIICKKY